MGGYAIDHHRPRKREKGSQHKSNNPDADTDRGHEIYRFFLFHIPVNSAHNNGNVIQQKHWNHQNIGRGLQPANIKQLVNAVLTFVVPTIVNYLNPIWQPEFGDASEVVQAVLLLAAPVVVWLVSQIAHAVDRKWIK